MARRLGLSLASVMLTLSSLTACGSLRGTAQTTPDWAVCTPNEPRACSELHGIALGEFAGSVELPGEPCDHNCDPIHAALESLDARAPAHAAIVAIDDFAPDRAVLCGDTLCAVSGYLGLFVFSFENGSSLPVVVSCPGISSCRPIGSYGDH